MDLSHLGSYNDELLTQLQIFPQELMPMLEASASDALKTLRPAMADDVPAFQVLLRGDMMLTSIRHVTARDVNRLVRVPGIVISATRTRPKAHKLALRCRNCGNTKFLAVGAALGGAVVPRTCDA